MNGELITPHHMLFSQCSGSVFSVGFFGLRFFTSPRGPDTREHLTTTELGERSFVNGTVYNVLVCLQQTIILYHIFPSIRLS